MRILVNDIAASEGGAKSIITDFYRHLVESGDQNQWLFLLSEAFIEETENIRVILRPDVKRSWLCRLWFDWFEGRNMVAELAPDVVLGLQNTAILGCPVPQYLYIHQSIPFQTVKRFSFLKREERIYAFYQYVIGALIKMSAKKAAGVIVQTKWMKQALEKYVSPENIYVIPPSLSLDAQRIVHAPNGNTFFYPAGGMIYKNHQLIETAVRELTVEGLTDFHVTFTLESTTVAPPALPQIRRIGKIPRSEVVAHYQKDILVFPSYIETYGLPLAEARTVNGMILAADTPFAREILDGYANVWFFDPTQPSELKALMKKAILGGLPHSVREDSAWPQDHSWSKLVKVLLGEV